MTRPTRMRPRPGPSRRRSTRAAAIRDRAAATTAAADGGRLREAPTMAPVGAGGAAAESRWLRSSSSSCSSSPSAAASSPCGPMRSGIAASVSTASSGPASSPRSSCSSAALLIALVFLLGSLWLADRTRPAGDRAWVARARSWTALRGRAASRRTNKFGAQGSAAPGRTGRRGGTRFRRSGPDGRDPIRDGRSARLHPDRAVGRPHRPRALFAIGRRQEAGNWETILLWATRSHSGRTGEAGHDPVFGRDIGFFLFELPFLRLVQWTQRPPARAPCCSLSARYAGGHRGTTLTTPIRVHLAVLGGLLLCRSRPATSSTSTSSSTAPRAWRPASAIRTRTPDSWHSTP